MNAIEYKEFCKAGASSRAMYMYHLPHKNVMGTVTPAPRTLRFDAVVFQPDGMDSKYSFICHFSSVKILTKNGLK